MPFTGKSFLKLKEYLKKLINDKERETKHYQVKKEHDNLSIANNEMELNVSNTQCSEGELVVKQLLYTKEASTYENEPFEDRKGILLSIGRSNSCEISNI